LLLLVVQIAAAPNDVVERISRRDLKPAKEGIAREREWSKEIIISSTVKLLARIEVTNKGNGALGIGNLKLRIVDSHDDGIFYEDEMLNIDFTDLDGDGNREMVLSGIACLTDEKGEKVLRREAIVFIYALQPNRTFKQIYRNTDIRLD